MHQQNKHQIFITMSMMVPKNLFFESFSLGTFFFDGNGNGQSYLNLLNDEVITLMTVLFQNQFHQNRFQLLWWAQDGAPCHALLAVRARLNQIFGERVSSLHNNTEWSPRSLDLNPCDIFLWGYLKDKFFRTPLESLNVLRQRIITECNFFERKQGFNKKICTSHDESC